MTGAVTARPLVEAGAAFVTPFVTPFIFRTAQAYCDAFFFANSVKG